MDDVTLAVVGCVVMSCDTGAESDVHECLVRVIFVVLTVTLGLIFPRMSLMR